MTSKLLNCLICNSYLNLKENTNESDDDEVEVGNDTAAEEIDCKKYLQFKLGLELLNKLLNVGEVDDVQKSNKSFNFEEGGIGGDGGGNLKSPPCCEECGKVIEEITRLQHAIKEMKVSLMKQVDKLKDVLLNTDYQKAPLKLPNDLNYLLQLRNQLLTSVRSNSTTLSSESNLEHRPKRKKRRRPSMVHRPPSLSIPPPKLPKEYQPCSVILTRLPTTQLIQYLRPTIQNTDDNSVSKVNQKCVPDIPLTCSTTPTATSTRKSKLKAIQFIHQQTSASSSKIRSDLHEEDEEFVPSPSPGSNQDDNDNYMDSDDDDYPWESEAPSFPEQNFSPMTLTPCIQKLSKPSKKFYLISPTTLLYHFTLIKVSQGYTCFTCQEPECPSPIFVDPSLNWYNLFILMADHIDTTHSTPPYLQKNDPLALPLKCPLCPLTFPPGRLFRRHLTGGELKDSSNSHCIETIVCEVCWRPIRNVADTHRAHQWHHKSSQEKEETEGGPPPKVLYNAKKKLSSNLFRKQKGKKIKDPSILEAISIVSKWKSGLWGKPTTMTNVKTVKKKEHHDKIFNQDKQITSLKMRKKFKSKIKSEREECTLFCTPSPKAKSKFIVISDNTLLYQYTLIKVSPGFNHFTCQESKCPSPQFSIAEHGGGEVSNWISVFDQIAIHIESVHKNPRKVNVRECVLCAIKLKCSAKDWRLHFTSMTGGGHGINMVICQICLKPLKNVAEFLRCHQWAHKNKMEKIHCEEGPPFKVKYSARKKLLLNQKLELTPAAPFLNCDQDQLELQQVDENNSESFPNSVSNNTDKNTDKFKFVVLSADSLLFKCTLIKISQGYTRFTCQEPGCPSPSFFTNELSNWASLFQQIVIHIDSTHENPLEEGVRECVLCTTKLQGTALDFRRHLTQGLNKGHWVRKVICEICLMPSRNLGDFYRCHQWSHKNDQEKNDCEEGPPPNVLKQLDHDQIKSEKSTVSSPSTTNVVRKRDTVSLAKFSIISGDTLLYKYTLIKVSQGYTHFTCQESGCPSPELVTNQVLNWRCGLEQIAYHIDLLHDNPLETNVRECVVCSVKLKSTARDFRRHLLRDFEGGHSIQTVACETCLKPIRDVASSYRCHQWSHKTEQEMRECEEEPPSKIKNAKKKYFEKKIGWKRPQNISSSSSKRFKPSLASVLYDKLSNDFAKIGKDKEDRSSALLIYKYTLLKATYGISLSCQQSNCDYITNGTDLTAFEEFRTHVKTCHPFKGGKHEKVTCPLCSVQLVQSSLRRHLLEIRHMLECPFICTTCWKPFKQRASLDWHQWSHKSDAEKANTSEELVPLKEKLKRDQRVFICDHCPKSFTYENGLKKHLEMHLPKEQRRQFSCPQCPHKFLSGAAVRAHVERKHDRELMRMRSCPICGKEYNRRDGYKFRTHMRSHRDERNWICEICGKAFLNTVGLKEHVESVHGNRERKYQCEFCVMNFTKNYHLSRHKRSVHRDKVGEETEVEKERRLKYTVPENRPGFIGPKIAYPCPACEKVFPLRSRMGKHLREYCKVARDLGMSAEGKIIGNCNNAEGN